MDKNKKTVEPNQEEETFLVGTNSVTSSTDCTGLIQTPAESEEELESYSEIYTLPTPKEDYPYKE
ncbi:MAG: hypothetical protein Q8882_02600 [Bacillota bacterium]|nr:hypothetical protein [Bacillota bacterium]